MLAVVEQQLAAFTKTSGGRLVELRVAGVIHPAVDDHAGRVHALGDPVGRIRNMLGDESLDADAADVLFPGIHAETVKLLRRLEIEEVAHEHFALGAIEIHLLAERQAPSQRPAPQHLTVVVRNIEVGTELTAVACGEDTGHVEPHLFIRALGRLEHERRFVPTLERHLFQAAHVVGVGVRDDQVLHVVNREPELRHLQRRLGSQIHEQSGLALDDDQVGLKHLVGEGCADAEEDDPQMTIGGQRQMALVLPDPNAGRHELRFVISQVQQIALEHFFSVLHLHRSGVPLMMRLCYKGGSLSVISGQLSPSVSL